MKKCSFLLAGVAMMLISSCTSYKNVPYLQNSAEVDLSAAAQLYDAKIMPKDLLSITVSVPRNPEAVSMFNLTVQSDIANTVSRRTTTAQATLQTYLVDNNGEIEFPVLGTIHVAGMTKTELEKYIESKVYPTYVKDKPIVTVDMSNYHVAILGEVSRPGLVTTNTGKLNIFEALAQAGDLTVYGLRENVKLIREDAQGKKKIVELNLNDANIIASPYYQLQQNDILYVTPNKTKAKNSDVGQTTSLWFSSVSILISLANLTYNILK